MFGSLDYVVYVKESNKFCLVRTSKKVMSLFEVEVGVQEGAQRCRVKLIIDVLVSSTLIIIHCCHIV